MILAMKYGVMERFRMHDTKTMYGLDLDRIGLLHQAKALGFDGVELGIGLDYREDPLWTGVDDTRQSIKEEAKRTSLEVPSICLHLLNYDEHSPASLVAEHRAVAKKIIVHTLEASSKIGVSVILVPFFGTAKLSSSEKIRHLVDEMKSLAVTAEEKKVYLALETSLYASDLMRVIEKIGSPYVKVYYDTGNSTVAGYDLVKEIELLKNSIVQVHVKDSPSGTLGEGSIDFNEVIKALNDISYGGYLMLETPSRGDSVKEARKNLDYLKEITEKYSL